MNGWYICMQEGTYINTHGHSSGPKVICWVSWTIYIVLNNIYILAIYIGNIYIYIGFGSFPPSLYCCYSLPSWHLTRHLLLKVFAPHSPWSLPSRYTVHFCTLFRSLLKCPCFQEPLLDHPIKKSRLSPTPSPCRAASQWYLSSTKGQVSQHRESCPTRNSTQNPLGEGAAILQEQDSTFVINRTHRHHPLTSGL